jgi:hypothetical protein
MTAIEVDGGHGSEPAIRFKMAGLAGSRPGRPFSGCLTVPKSGHSLRDQPSSPEGAARAVEGGRHAHKPAHAQREEALRAFIFRLAGCGRKKRMATWRGSRHYRCLIDVRMADNHDHRT